MSTVTSTDVRKKIQPKMDLQPPGKFHVIFMNDDVTSMDFVMAVLGEVFNYNAESAFEITMKIHHEGQASVAVLPYELAEQKAIEVTLLARNNNFPLDVRIRAED